MLSDHKQNASGYEYCIGDITYICHHDIYVTILSLVHQRVLRQPLLGCRADCLVGQETSVHRSLCRQSAVQVVAIGQIIST